MNNTKVRSILIIVVSALLVSVLFNIRAILWVFEALSQYDAIEFSRNIDPRLYYVAFNFIIEFIVFCLVALLNYSWLEKIINLDRFSKGRNLIIIISNLIIFFILIPGGKIFHKVYFLNKYSGKEIEFDIRNYLIINISVFLLALLVANLLLLMKKMRIAEEKNIRLIEEKAKAELSALKEQISPHHPLAFRHIWHSHKASPQSSNTKRAFKPVLP